MCGGADGLTAPRAFATPHSMSTPRPKARVELRRLGREGQPLVVIDDFSGQLAALREAHCDIGPSAVAARSSRARFAARKRASAW